MKLRLFRSEAEAELETLRYALVYKDSEIDDLVSLLRQTERERDRLGARLCEIEARGLGSNGGGEHGR